MFGKLCVTNKLMLPKLTYINTILPNITRKNIKEIENICWKFMNLNQRSVVDSAKIYSQQRNEMD